MARPFSRRRIELGLLIALATVPFVVALVVLWSRPWWHPGGDEALVSLRAWDVGRDTPTLGPYSRYGWNHPGPLLFWLLAVPVRLLGDLGHGAATGAILINASAAVAVVVLVARRVGVVASAGAVGLIAVLIIAGPDFVWSAWNPYVTVLPFLAYLVATWSVAEGDLAGWPVAGLAAVFCVQSHIGFASLVVALAAVALTLRTVAWWRGGRPPLTRRAVVVAGGSVLVSVGLMTPVLLDQFTGTGNLGRLVDWFGGPGRETIGVNLAAGLVSRQLNPWGPWSGGAEVVLPLAGTTAPMSPWWLALPTLALLGTTAIALARRDTTVLRLIALVASSAVVGLVAVASITPPAFPYLFTWIRVIAAALWATVALGLARAVRRRTLATGATVLAVVLLAVVPIVMAAVSMAQSPLPESPTARATDELLPAARALVPPGGTFSIASDDPYTRVVEGLGVALVEEGRRVVVDADHARAWGGHREGDVDGPGVTRLHIVAGHQSIEAGGAPGWVEVARWDPLDPGEQAEREQLRRRLLADAEALGKPGLGALLDTGPWELLTADDTGLDPAEVHRYVELARQGRPVALFEDRSRSDP